MKKLLLGWLLTPDGSRISMTKVWSVITGFLALVCLTHDQIVAAGIPITGHAWLVFFQASTVVSGVIAGHKFRDAIQQTPTVLVPPPTIEATPPAK